MSKYNIRTNLVLAFILAVVLFATIENKSNQVRVTGVLATCVAPEKSNNE